MKAVELCRPGVRWAEVGNAVASVAEPAGFSVVRNFTGHGLGKLFHQAPALPHHAGSDIGGVMQPG
jgi:methionyl aminopeptidase